METIDFQNTGAAFTSKSDRELRRMKKLFTLMGQHKITKIGVFLINIALLVRLPVKKLIKRTLFGQFCGGETLNECKYTINSLYRFGIQSIPDYSVEGGQGREQQTLTAVNDTIKFVSSAPAASFAVFKCSGLSSVEVLEKGPGSSGWQFLQERVESLCAEAQRSGVKLMVDAEESWLQQHIDTLSWGLIKKFNQEKPVLWITMQMYRVDALSRLHALYASAVEAKVVLGIKLVRGAYMEKERTRASQKQYQDPILPNKEATDRAFDEALNFCVAHLDRISICAGTHNEESNKLLVRLMHAHDISVADERVHFAQLFGMGDNISFNLSALGYKVSKYLPFGPVELVIPYLFRRAEENTSVEGQASRELALIKREMHRRGI